jgi:UDP-N-acetylglucosamine 1-carboxyvinyltransferase
MGAKINGIGSDRLRILGVGRLHSATHRIIPDRIETGTYIMAAAATGGEVRLTRTRLDLVTAVARLLAEAGVEVTAIEDGIKVRTRGEQLDGVDVMTEPYPGYPTDLQAQFMALMTRSSGTSHITETIFENRFMHVQELARLGAKISLSGQTAKIEGVPRLRGAQVMATDLRASVSLVIAGLAAEGETVVSRVYHLDRGFERLEEKLTRCGANVERISE